MRLFRTWLGVFVLFGSVSLSAATVSIGQLYLLSETPSYGNQSLAVFNSTGSCDGSFSFVCDNINISNWTLTVDFTNSGGPQTQVLTPTGPGDVIGPGSFYSPPSWTFDQSCTSGSCPPFDTTITKVIFTGSIGSVNPTVLNVLLSPGGSSSTFFASNTFTVEYTPVLVVDSASGYVYSDPVDILVNSYSGSNNNVPEPSGLVLLAVGISAVATKFSHCRASR